MLSVRITIVPALLLTACGGPLTGSWMGDCDLVFRDKVEGLDVSLYVSKAKGGTLEGTADIDGHDGSYALEGTEDESTVVFTLHRSDTDDESGTDLHWWLDFAGTLDDEADPPLLGGSATYWTEIYQDGASIGTSDPWEGTCDFEGLD